ncbi:MAG: AHH domain-containing protein [Sideroxyarcus sp.]|nr:AHH domain-containing protein [Sideroxyarcus sp.]
MIISNANNRRCANNSDGISEGAQCQSAPPKISLKDKAALLLQKSQAKELRKNLKSAGEDDAKGCAAHHIVPKNENRDWAKDDAKDARDMLDSCGIDIDDAINGVYLPFNKDAECEGANHRRLHTKAYYGEVAKRLLKAALGDCGEVENQLSKIKSELRQNTFIGGVH